MLKKQRSARGCCRTRGNPWKGARGHQGVDSVAEYRSLIVARVYPWLKDSGTGSPLFRWLRHSAAPLGYPSGIYSSSSFVRSFALFTCSDSSHQKRPPFNRFATKLSPRKYSLNAFHPFFLYFSRAVFANARRHAFLSLRLLRTLRPAGDYAFDVRGGSWLARLDTVNVSWSRAFLPSSFFSLSLSSFFHVKSFSYPR